MDFTPKKPIHVTYILTRKEINTVYTDQILTTLTAYVLPRLLAHILAAAFQN